MSPEKKKRMDDILDGDGTEIDQAIQRGINHALRQHKAAGRSIAIWRDGKVVLVPADEIVIEGDDVEPGEGDRGARDQTH